MSTPDTGYTSPARPRLRGRSAALAHSASVAGSREEVLRRHLPLVRRVVQRLAARKPPHIENGDLVSWGIVGLLDAIGKYDPKKAASFATYAQFRIRGAILDHLRSPDWVPRSVRQTASLVAEAIRRLPEREQLVVTLYYHEELTMKETGAVLGLTESRVSQLHSQAMLRLKGFLGHHFGRAAAGVVVAPPDATAATPPRA